MRDKEYAEHIYTACSLNRIHGTRAATVYTKIEIPLEIKEYPNYYRDNYPRHECKLDPLRQEFILCTLCEDRLQMSRHTPRVNPRLTQNHSTYHPQALKYCQCKSTALLVDHRGIPRIYNSTDSWQLVMQPLGYERRVQEEELDYQYIPRPLLDNLRRPRFIPEDTSRIPLRTNAIVLRSTNKSNQISFLITPKYPIKAHPVNIEHYRRYAFTYKIIILTDYLIFLPSGIYIPLDNPKVKELLKESLNNRSLLEYLIAPRDHLSNLEANTAFQYLNRRLQEIYNLPLTQLEEYPLQAIGYLHLIPSNTQLWEFQLIEGRWHSTTTVINHLTNLRRTINRIISQISFCKSDVHLMALWVRDYLHPRPLLIPPISSYYTSRKLDLRLNHGVL